MELFEDYEIRVLNLLDNHGGVLLERLRSVDGNSEVHLPDFPDTGAFDAFRADPARAALQELWSKCGALTDVKEMRRLGEPKFLRSLSEVLTAETAVPQNLTVSRPDSGAK